MKVPNKMDNVQSKEQGFYDFSRDMTRNKVKKYSECIVETISHCLGGKEYVQLVTVYILTSS